MNSAPSDQSLSTTRKVFAIVLSGITVFCAGLYLLGYAFVAAQIHAGVYGGPELLIAVTFFTLPPAAICTTVAMVLVGPLRCKLAWISFCSFALPYVALFLWMLWAEAHHMVSK